MGNIFDVDTSLQIGYNLLSTEQKRRYNKFHSDVLARKKEIVFDDPGMTSEQLQEIFFAVRQDDPNLFYLSKAIESYSDEDGTVVIPKYLFGKIKEKLYRRRIERKASRILKNLPKEILRKEISIYMLLSSHITFPRDYPDGERREEYQTVIGSILNGVAVCSGTAHAINLLLNRAGIRCGCVRGIREGEEIGHSWNIVEIGGRYYHLDATLDTKKTFPNFDLFNVSDDVMKEFGFTWTFNGICDDDTLNYYKLTNGLVPLCDVKSYVSERLLQGRTTLLFKIVDSENIDVESLSFEILSAVKDSIHNAKVQFILNEESGVISIFVE